MARSFLRVSDLSRAELAGVLGLALRDKREPEKTPAPLRGQSVTLYFNKPSTRTRISFETAVHRLGGLPVTVGPADLQMGRGETIEDTARVISRYSAAFVTRTYSDQEIARFTKAATIPVVNALTDGHHPCQALADAMTLLERFGELRGLSVAYVGAGNNVVHSLLEVCALSGMHARIATPPQYAVDPQILADVRTLAAENGADLLVTDNPEEAVRGADAVYTDTWLSMGDPDAERADRIRVLGRYAVDAALFEKADPAAIFLHCLPAHRGEEVTDDVMDSPRSAVFDQAENKLWTSMAILEALTSGDLRG